MESGHAVAVVGLFQDMYGATRDEAVSKMEEAIDAWVLEQKPRTDGIT
jgi:hypothetical protein